MKTYHLIPPIMYVFVSFIPGVTFASEFEPLEKIASLSNDQIDLLSAKLTIDHLIDPSIDKEGVSKAIDQMVIDVKTILPTNASPQNRLIGLRRYIYLAGAWNKFTPYAYDLDDPFGENIHNKLISTYLTTQKGNCVSMPILFLILGQKLDLNISLAEAPAHLFLKFKPDTETIVNLEATDHAAPMSDENYIRQTHISELAIRKGTYLHPLNKKETVSMMMLELLEFYESKDQPEKMVTLANISLSLFPNNVNAMMHKAFAYNEIIRKEFQNRYPDPRTIPSVLQPRFIELSRNREKYIAQADSLGYRPPDEATDNQYRATIQKMKSQH